MDGYLQAVAAVLLAVILITTLKQIHQPMSILLGLSVTLLVMAVALRYIKPVLDFLDELRRLGNLPGEMVMVLLKVTGISVISEIAALVCKDSGNSSLAQSLKILSTGVILYLSIPIFQVLTDLVQKILEGSA